MPCTHLCHVKTRLRDIGWFSAEVVGKQRGSSLVEFVETPVNLSEFMCDIVQRSKISTPPVPCFRCVWRLYTRRSTTGTGAGFAGVDVLVPVDGQVPVRAEVTGEDVPNPAGQRVRGHGLAAGTAAPPIGRSAGTPAPRWWLSSRGLVDRHRCGDSPVTASDLSMAFGDDLRC